MTGPKQQTNRYYHLTRTRAHTHLTAHSHAARTHARTHAAFRTHSHTKHNRGEEAIRGDQSGLASKRWFHGSHSKSICDGFTSALVSIISQHTQKKRKGEERGGSATGILRSHIRSPEEYRLMGCAVSVAEQGWCHHESEKTNTTRAHTHTQTRARTAVIQAFTFLHNRKGGLPPASVSHRTAIRSAASLHGLHVCVMNCPTQCRFVIAWIITQMQRPLSSTTQARTPSPHRVASLASLGPIERPGVKIDK